MEEKKRWCIRQLFLKFDEKFDTVSCMELLTIWLKKEVYIPWTYVVRIFKTWFGKIEYEEKRGKEKKKKMHLKQNIHLPSGFFLLRHKSVKSDNDLVGSTKNRLFKRWVQIYVRNQQAIIHRLNLAHCLFW